MGLLPWIRDRIGHIATLVAAALVFVGAVLPFVFGPLFGSPRFIGSPGLLAAALFSASLIDRFRPSRWFLLVALPVSWLAPLLALPSSEYRPVVIFQAACATGAWVLLNSSVVRRHFELGYGRIERFLAAAGLQESADTVDDLPGEAPCLPAESIEISAPAASPKVAQPGRTTETAAAAAEGAAHSA